MRFLTIITAFGTILFFTVVARAHPASGIVVDSKGNIYFSDLETVWRVDSAGQLNVFRDGVRGRHVHEPDGSTYLTDSDSLRKVAMDGSVTTLATKLSARSSQDSPTLFSSEHGNLAGLTVATDGTIFVADSRNRRLLKVANGKVETVFRSEPPFFPTGAFATKGGDVYVLEVGLTLPNVTSGPRVRKLSPDGTISAVATIGEDRSKRSTQAVAVERAGIVAESAVQFVWEGRATKYALLAVAVFSGTFLILRYKRKERKV